MPRRRDRGPVLRRRSMSIVPALLAAALLSALVQPARGRAVDETVDEVHYSFTGATSVALDWRGSATDVRYGKTADYGETATAHLASPTPAGPFQEVEIKDLDPGTRYHYSIGGGPDEMFATAPTGDCRFDVTADI